MNIAIYSRKSKFTGKGESIENQVELCQEYAQRQFGDICHFLVYQDEGFSAKNTDRPMFQKMMDDIRSKKIETLICYRLDRISRNVSDFSAILDELERFGVSFISIRESFDTTSPIGRAMMYLSSVFAQLERETIAERIKDNRIQSANTGHWQGGSCPLGYQTKKVETIGKNEKKHSYYILCENKNTSGFIRELFSLYLEFGSLAKLERYYGAKIPKGVLGQYLSNPAYATNTEMTYDYFQSLGTKISNPRCEFDGNHGLLAYNRTQSYSKDSKRRRLSEQEWIIAIGEHIGLVHGDIWTKVQMLRKENQKKYPRWQSSNISLLSGFLFCKSCGAPMKIQNQKVAKDGKRNFYYVCTNKQKSNGVLCNQPNIPGIKYDQAFIADLKKNLQGIPDISLYVHPCKFPSNRNQDKTIQILKNKISENDTTIKNLIRKLSIFSSSHMDEYIQKTIEEIEQENREYKIQLDELILPCQSDTSKKISIDHIQKLLENFDQCTLPQKRTILKHLVKKIYCSKESSLVELNVQSLF